MRSKAIISLMLIAALVLSTAMAFADNYNAQAGRSVTADGWTVTDGSFGGTFGTGVYSTRTDSGYSRAVHPIILNPNGTHAFTATFTFKLNNATTGIWLGVDSGTARSNQRVVGWRSYGAAPNSWFVASIDGAAQIPGTNGAFLNMSPNQQPQANREYKAVVSSTNGNTLSLSIQDMTSNTIAGPVTMSFPAGQNATHLVIQISNRGATPGTMSTPIVTDVAFSDQGGSAPTPTPSASPSATPVPVDTHTAYLQGMREFYANQPIVHMSNQSVVYNPDGTIKQVITGNVTNATATPIPAVVGTPTAKPNATATAVPAVTTATPVATVPGATKTQAPGFEMILAAIGMISALVLITRKKK